MLDTWTPNCTPSLVCKTATSELGSLGTNVVPFLACVVGSVVAGCARGDREECDLWIVAVDVGATAGAGVVVATVWVSEGSAGV